MHWQFFCCWIQLNRVGEDSLLEYRCVEVGIIAKRKMQSLSADSFENLLQTESI